MTRMCSPCSGSDQVSWVAPGNAVVVPEPWKECLRITRLAPPIRTSGVGVPAPGPRPAPAPAPAPPPGAPATGVFGADGRWSSCPAQPDRASVASVADAVTVATYRGITRA